MNYIVTCESLLTGKTQFKYKGDIIKLNDDINEVQAEHLLKSEAIKPVKVTQPKKAKSKVNKD